MANTAAAKARAKMRAVFAESHSFGRDGGMGGAEFCLGSGAVFFIFVRTLPKNCLTDDTLGGGVHCANSTGTGSDTGGAGVPRGVFGSDAVGGGAVFEWENSETRLLEVGDGAADGIVQSAGSFVGIGDAIEAGGRGGSDCVEHGESWGGGGVGGEVAWGRGADFFARGMQSCEAGADCFAGGGDCGERRGGFGGGVRTGERVCEAAWSLFFE